MNPQVILALITTLAPIVRQGILDFQQAHEGRFPTEEELTAQFSSNIDKYLGEGAAWRAAHPKT